jgi:hypothetical protein
MTQEVDNREMNAELDLERYQLQAEIKNRDNA